MQKPDWAVSQDVIEAGDRLLYAGTDRYYAVRIYHGGINGLNERFEEFGRGWSHIDAVIATSPKHALEEAHWNWTADHIELIPSLDDII